MTPPPTVPLAAPARVGPPSPAPRRRRLRWPLGPVPSLALLLLAALATWLTYAPLPTGTLLVRVRAPSGPVSSGSILVDGTEAGAPGTPIRVSAGPHAVAFAAPGFAGDARRVEVATNETTTLDLPVREAPARLSVTTTPAGATVRIPGRPPAPAPLSVELPPGSYDVAVAAPGHAPRTLPVRLGRGEQRTVAVELAAVEAPRPPPFERGVTLAPTPVLAAPNGAETGEVLAGGTAVQVLGTVGAEGAWLQVRGGANGRVGFVRAGSLEAFDSWASRNGVVGTLDGVTGNLRLVVSGRPVPLAGVRLPEGTPSPALSRITGSLLGVLRGAVVRCLPQDAARFLCKTGDGRDVGEMFLLNGGAMLGAGAPPYYEEAERAARERGRGLWSE